MATIRNSPDQRPQNLDDHAAGDSAMRGMTRFVLIAIAVIVALGIVYWVAHAIVQPSSTADSTAAGVAASTTPPDAVNGGGVAGTGGAAPYTSGVTQNGASSHSATAGATATNAVTSGAAAS